MARPRAGTGATRISSASRWLPAIIAVAIVGAVIAAVAGTPAEPGAVIGPDDVGEIGSGKRIELARPVGPGPFPAVVVLHPCNGVGPSTRRWARRLQDWGYEAAIIDSFGPRGRSNVCDRGIVVAPSTRADDAAAAARFLAARPEVRRDRIAVLGMSHGAGGVLAAAARSEPPMFRAAVALYPWCPATTPALGADTLILIGDADDWTPAPRCVGFAEREAPSGRVALKVYPGALHAFDNGARISTYYGHRVGSDPTAAADAFTRIRAFLDDRLKR